MVNALIHSKFNDINPNSVAHIQTIKQAPVIFTHISTVQIIYVFVLTFYHYNSKSTYQISLKLW